MRSAAAIALVLVGVLAGAAPAAAAPTSDVVEGRHVRIVSTTDPTSMRQMLPGDVALWDVSVSADAPEPGSIEIALSGSGDLPLVIDVRSCAEAWHGSGCASGEEPVARALPAPLDGALIALLETDAHDATHLRLEVAVPREAAAAPGSTTLLRVHVDGYGDALEATTPGGGIGALPSTSSPLGGAALLALAAVACGVGTAMLAAGARQRRRS